MRINRQSNKGGFIEFIKTIFYALLLAGVIRTLLFQPFWIPSGSMKPTLLVGDFIFVNKFSYGYSRFSCPFSLCPIKDRIFFSAPKRGDIIVFRHPTNGKDFVKRLIGLPGDTVAVNNGKLIINDKKLNYIALDDFVEVKEKQGPLSSIPRCKDAPVPLGSDCLKSEFTEVLPTGSSHSVLDIGSFFGDNTPEFTVPINNNFFLGDNRDNSLDSRFGLSSGGVGFVPSKYLIGRVDRIIFSSAGKSMLFFWKWRSDRFFRSTS